jgi:hypothetical protein
MCTSGLAAVSKHVRTYRVRILASPTNGIVMELVDEAASKVAARKSVWVQVPPVPIMYFVCVSDPSGKYLTQ